MSKNKRKHRHDLHASVADVAAALTPIAENGADAAVAEIANEAPPAVSDDVPAFVPAADLVDRADVIMFAEETAPPDDATADNATTDIAVAESRLEAAADVPVPRPQIGARLRAAREALGLAREDIARATHLSSAVIADIENDNFARAGAPIYVRGYLRSYARAVNIPDFVVEMTHSRSEPETPVLMPSHGARTRVDLVSRYWNPLAYAALTAVVIVPVWFLLQPLLVTTTRTPDLSPIDAPRAELLQVPMGTPTPAEPPAPVATAASDTPPGPPESLAGAQTSVRQTPAESEYAPQRPLMASMTPMLEPATNPGGARTVTLRLTQPSWVEFIGGDGQRLEFALLPAGTEREYQLAGRADLRIGNVRGATLLVDGRPVDLGQFARGNIAQVTIGDETRAQ